MKKVHYSMQPRKEFKKLVTMAQITRLKWVYAYNNHLIEKMKKIIMKNVIYQQEYEKTHLTYKYKTRKKYAHRQRV